MAWVAVDNDGSEYIYERQPIRQVRFWMKSGDSESVELPNGIIETLIGRKLTWSDEPVELKEIAQQPEPTCPICQSNRILEWPDKYQCRKCKHVWERSAE